jgi:hypothetical protein
MPLLHSGCAQHLFLNSVLLGFLLQHYPCLVPDDRVTCTMQEWYGRSTVGGQRPTYSRSHYHSRSISSVAGGTLRLDAGPHIDPPVLW